ncbi:hypothetical protein BJ875DRAFT_463225 [Amylocarpus encephaloides]|uniref:Zn(2)-C6 fungal-type domain-containing protein n=1 Tax=Amylocarpus encephaloides TaxID=45428 RepID=A0A9P8C694_9HELO|nr:hypothetical protein BJ875DRAFT_463225 [Amylocarpus encephaloides]
MSSNIMNSTSEPHTPPSSVKVPRKRKRIVISCTECHRRKQKCDRASPCSNCVARNKQSLCQYENESARKQQLLEDKVNAGSINGGAFSIIKPDRDTETAAQITGLGYAQTNGSNNTTLGIFQKIQKQDSDGDSPMVPPPWTEREQSSLRHKYKTLIRQLPSKHYIDELLQTYFREVNYQYYPLDEGIFRDHLQNWYNLSFATLSRGPLELHGDLQFFPALLFQCLALALQYQPLDYDPALDALKYAGGMTFDDLAQDYSESGVSILALLGKRHTTLVTVQAGFLRTSYLKSVGMIPESWHSLSSTIRDAQEVGLHEDASFLSRRPDDRPEDVLEGLWLDQLRRRMWMILKLWDIHMAIVLGRPTTIDSRDGTPNLPLDAQIPKNRREEAPSPRTANDPPTPLTHLLWNVEISAPLWDIFNLEKEDPHQNNLEKVETMHSMINKIPLHCPPYFRSHNPDATFDCYPECYWLQSVRPILRGNSAFTIMALHRPYIFTNNSSRSAAVSAALDILRSQRELFDKLTSLHYKMFSLVLNTFDAIVLVAAVYILHPYENREHLDDALQQFDWGMERFQTMASRNSMAKVALGVLKAIHVRLVRALKLQTGAAKPIPSPEPSATPETQPPVTSQYPPLPDHHLSISSASSNPQGSEDVGTPGTSTYTLPTISNLTSPPGLTTSSSPMPGWDTLVAGSVPQNYDFSSMAPLQPMHDLLYKSLDTGMESADAGVYETGTWDVAGLGVAGGGGMAAAPWQFAGDFRSDSFWEFMNSYQP